MQKTGPRQSGVGRFTYLGNQAVLGLVCAHGRLRDAGGFEFRQGSALAFVDAVPIGLGGSAAKRIADFAGFASKQFDALFECGAPFGGLMAAMPLLPVFGPAAKLQPVFVDDAAEAVGNVLADPAAHGGKIYELAGPEVVTMGELNRRIAKAAGRSPLLVELPDALSGVIAAATGWLPGAPITTDQWKLLKAGNVATGTLPGIAALGVQPECAEQPGDHQHHPDQQPGQFTAQAEPERQPHSRASRTRRAPRWSSSSERRVSGSAS